MSVMTDKINKKKRAKNCSLWCRKHGLKIKNCQ